MLIHGINRFNSIQYNNLQAKKNIKPQVTAPSFKKEGYVDPAMSRDTYRANFEESIKKHKDNIFAHLDTVMIDHNGKKVSVTEALQTLFPKEAEEAHYTNLKHKTMRENVDNIINNGFDFSKITLTNYGPGIYFGSEGDIQIYQGDTLNASFDGRAATSLNVKSYNQVREKLENEVRNYFRMGFTDIEKVMIEHEVISTALNEYCRNKIVDELGIDGVIAPEVGYFVVFNPNSITDVKRA